MATGQARLTFGFTELNDGFQLLPVLIGMFAVNQILADIINSGKASETKTIETKGAAIRWSDLLKHGVNLIRSSIVGTWIGLLPGIGANIGSVTAYSVARASLFTGHYPHTTGILRNADNWTKGWTTDLQNVGYHTVNVGKMHTWPQNTEMGFNQRYVVENKDRYLEARWFFDEWDKALRARGLVKQQRELYRQLDDYKSSLGAFDWLLDEDMHPDNFVGDLATWWLKNDPDEVNNLWSQPEPTRSNRSCWQFCESGGFATGMIRRNCGKT